MVTNAVPELYHWLDSLSGTERINIKVPFTTWRWRIHQRFKVGVKILGGITEYGFKQ